MPNLILPLLLVLMLVFLFFQFRKQKKQMNETMEMQAGLTVGTKVMTSTGLYGTVVGLGEDTVDLEIAPGITTTWVRRAVAKILTPEELGAPSIETITDDEGHIDLDKRSEDR
ncbi:preprotein translocase subunit YajC [Tsukamurella pulmonis]|uniref:Preprotein translocase subunit YajC n=1 Tax=Tsukamurella pulmonis TaxID=47312 RepID=A0A1H1EHS0_9ACTN|nr:preprotein translocase subunit YajC [Tsukamurella pulmonis]KXO91935.1 preprotein translocase subunit YajC [Tsukamurella pulmonis]KXP09585.1 preprotein translocase subunit YajC [Tsukamurella pulmonis]RDH09540.1 preprotein translocase subunit YajC [Tsukamurella pulmonis]SDQ88174.1 preprotein translocase subunit YajC [Tsukamurella pulmonis]SUP20873.1 preprotein translocase subunit YajC [Tsukamurella pulmonis]